MILVELGRDFFGTIFPSKFLGLDGFPYLEIPKFIIEIYHIYKYVSYFYNFQHKIMLVVFK